MVTCVFSLGSLTAKFAMVSCQLMAQIDKLNAFHLAPKGKIDMHGEMDPFVRFVLSAVIVTLIVLVAISVAAFTTTSIARLFADMWFPNRSGKKRSKARTVGQFLIDLAYFAIFIVLMIGLNVILATIIDGMSIIESAFSILRFALSYVGGFIGPYLPQFIVIIGVTISFLLFRLKAGHKIKYGLLEAIFAVVAMISVSGQMSLASGVISPPNITFAGAIYVFIRGLTNIYEGLSGKARKQFDAWFLGRPIEEANSNSAAGK